MQNKANQRKMMEYDELRLGVGGFFFFWLAGAIFDWVAGAFIDSL